MANRKSATVRLLNYLQTGRDITAEQARQRFGVKNITARVSELRAAGYPVYLNEKTTENGRTIKAYRLGAATRRQVAAGHILLSDPILRAAFASQIDAAVNSL